VLLRENEAKSGEINKLKTTLKKASTELSAKTSEIENLKRQLLMAENENKRLKQDAGSKKAPKPANLTMHSTPVRRSAQPSGAVSVRSSYNYNT
jgi:hypothetical protein